MKHLVTIMVNGQSIEATIRLGEDAPVLPDEVEKETPIETPEMTTEERLQDAETALGIMFGEETV